MTILVTNDDGDTQGLRILLKAAKRIDKNAYAIMPSKQRSAISKALTLHKALRFHEIEKNVYDLNGTPADIVLFALYSGEVPKPTLILSGINFGDNTSESSVLSSGTLGACWEALLAGVPAIAFSIYKGRNDWQKRRTWENKKNWGKETVLVNRVAALVQQLRKKTGDHFFSVNLPTDVQHARVVWPTHLQRLRFNTEIHKRTDPVGVPYYWIGGDFAPREKGTDLYEVAVNNNIAVTAISLQLVKNLNPR